MSQEDGPIDVNAFDLDIKAIGRQIIGAFIPIDIEDSQYIANQIAVSSFAFLLLLPFSVQI